jgi:inhibitor of KinA sporulation pathway (predicted exonuclease)
VFDGEVYDSAFKTLDARDYSSIATIETRRGVVDISSSVNDLQVAVVENSLSPQIKEESVVRLYDVGRLKADEEDFEDMDDDDDNPDGDDDGEELALGDDDEEDEEDEEEIFIPKAVQPIKPAFVKEETPFYAVVKIEKTVEGEKKSLTKKFVPETLSIAVRVFSTEKAAKNEQNPKHLFHRLVRPTACPKLNAETIASTGITQAMVDNVGVQPFDEVMRNLDSFFKELNLLSICKKKKTNMLDLDFKDFCVISDVEDIEHLRKEITYKNFQNLNNVNLVCLKKYISYKSNFNLTYKKDLQTVEEMLHSVCEQATSNKNKLLAANNNISQLIKVMLADGCGFQHTTSNIPN